MKKAKVPGLTPEQLMVIQNILKELEEAWIFGSRATGKHQAFSDVDICIKSTRALSDAKMSVLKSMFQESSLPYKVDLVDYYQISDDFKKLIFSHAVKL